MAWELAEAANNLSEVVTRALEEGPQRIRHGGRIVVVLSDAEFDRLRGERSSFIDYLLSGPDSGGLDLARDQSPMRAVDW